MRYTIVSVGKDKIGRDCDCYLMIEGNRETLLATIKCMKKEGTKILEVYKTNKQGIHTNIKF